MTGRHHVVSGSAHGSWTPTVARPSWPLAVHGSGAHRACPDRLAGLSRPGERTLRLSAFVRGGRRG